MQSNWIIEMFEHWMLGFNFQCSEDLNCIYIFYSFLGLRQFQIDFPTDTHSTNNKRTPSQFREPLFNNNNNLHGEMKTELSLHYTRERGDVDKHNALSKLICNRLWVTELFGICSRFNTSANPQLWHLKSQWPRQAKHKNPKYNGSRAGLPLCCTWTGAVQTHTSMSSQKQIDSIWMIG